MTDSHPPTAPSPGLAEAGKGIARRHPRRRTRLISLAAAAALLAFCGIGHAAPLDLVLLLENSAAVKQADPEQRLRDALSRFVRILEPEDRVAVILYDDLASPVLPLTPGEQHTAFSDSLETLALESEFANGAAGLERAIYELNRHGRAGHDAVIWLLQASPLRTGLDQRDQTFREWMRDVLAENAKQAGIQVHVTSLGDGADTSLGKHLSTTTGGTHWHAGETLDVEQVLTRLARSLQRTEPIAEPPAGEADRPEPETADAPAEPPAADAMPESVPEPAIADRQQATPPTQPLTRPETPAPDAAGEAPPPPPRPLPRTQAPTSGDAGQTADTPRADWVRYALAGAALAVILSLFYLAWRSRGSGMARIPAPRFQTRLHGTEPRLVDLAKVSGHDQYVLTRRMIRISRLEAEETDNVVTITIPQKVISRDHAYIEQRDGEYWLTDCGSNNGTYVNQQRIQGSVRLASNDVIKFATHEFRFECPECEQPAEPADEATAIAPAADQTLVKPAADDEPPQAGEDDRTKVKPAAEDEPPQAGEDDRTKVKPAADDEPPQADEDHRTRLRQETPVEEPQDAQDRTLVRPNSGD